MQQRADEHGLTPEEHAERVFDKVAEGKYWVIPQPDELLPVLQPHTDMILAEKPPELPSARA
ncbi:hypothetical protein [Saccharopolyspora shandongensis]|uniref:hypothetical protein n=1 Tax=Saccharopolyspora shandongensis TaxID=418495 RepID=UPI0033D0FC73